MTSRSLSAVPIRALSLLCIAMLGVGCGGRPDDEPVRASVSGMVTFDGEPLSEGVIRFIPTEGTTGPQVTGVISNGAFELPESHGPVVGTHRVEINSTDTGGLAMDDEEALVRLSSEKRRPRIKIVQIPPIYNRHHLQLH